MTSSKIRIIILTVLIIVATQFLPADTVHNYWQKNSQTALYVGNSMLFVYDIPGLVEQLSSNNTCSGGVIRPIRELYGGYTLRQHWNDKKALNIIQNSHPKYVILQEQSDVTLQYPQLRSEFTNLFVQAALDLNLTPLIYGIDIGWWSEDQRAKVERDNSEISSKLKVPMIDAIREFASERIKNAQFIPFGGDNHHLSRAGALLIAKSIASKICGPDFVLENDVTDPPQYIWQLWLHICNRSRGV